MAAAGVSGLLAAGAMMLTLGSAGAAMAQCSPSQPETNCSAAASTTTASVNMTTQEQITDNTSAITFPTPVTLPATNEQGSPAVSLTVNTNDTKGYSVNVANNATCSNSSMAVAGTGCADTIPAADLTVSGNATSGNYVSVSTTPITDSSAGPSAGGGDSLTDNYQLTIPSGTPAGNYSTVLQYSVTGN